MHGQGLNWTHTNLFHNTETAGMQCYSCFLRIDTRSWIKFSSAEFSLETFDSDLGKLHL